MLVRADKIFLTPWRNKKLKKFYGEGKKNWEGGGAFFFSSLFFFFSFFFFSFLSFSLLFSPLSLSSRLRRCCFAYKILKGGNAARKSDPEDNFFEIFANYLISYK